MNQRGTLDLQQINDADILTVEDSEFGFIYQIRPKSPGKPVYLYATPPDKKLIGRVRNQPPMPVTDKQFPALLMETNGRYGILVHRELNSGEEIIASAVNGRDDLLEVATYRSVSALRPDMPESGREIEIIDKGYICKSDAERMQSTESFRKVKSVLFPHDDLVADVNQSIFGNCFLLSSILAILHRKPEGAGAEFIRGMMFQEGEYTVVRLFDPNTNNPVYIRVKNSAYCQDDECTVKHKALWVHILEKAYTALALKKREGKKSPGINKYEYALPSFHEMFGSGGAPESALYILTGQSSVEKPIRCTPNYAWESDSLIYSMMVNKRIAPAAQAFADGLEFVDTFLDGKTSGYLRPLQKILCKDEADPEAIVTGFAGKLYEGNQNRYECEQLLSLINNALLNKSRQEQIDILNSLGLYLDEFIKLRIDSPLPVSTLLKNIRHIAKLGAYVETVMNAGKWQELTAIARPATSYELATRFVNQLSSFRPSMPADIREIFRRDIDDAILGNLRWNGPLGTGHYNAATLSIYDDIKQQTDNNFSLVASTHNTFPEPVAGLRANHAYAIVDAYEKEGYKYVRLRNPWGHTGRNYHCGEKGYVEEAYEDPRLGTFSVELSDFVKYFERYTIGKIPAPEQLLSLQAQHPHRRSSPDKEIPLLERNRDDRREEGFFARHWKAITVATVAGAASGLAAGAGLGVAAAVFGFVPTFGLSMLAIPVFAAIGFAGGALTGFVSSIAGSLIVDHCGGNTKRKFQGNIYEPVAVNGSPNHSPGRSPDNSPARDPRDSPVLIREALAEKGKESTGARSVVNPAQERNVESNILPMQMPEPVRVSGARDAVFAHNDYNAIRVADTRVSASPRSAYEK